MQRMSFLAKTLPLVFVLLATNPSWAFDGCNAADISGDGQVDFFDLGLITPTDLPRNDLDGSGAIDEPDTRMAFGHVFRNCTNCTADLDGDLDVDADDRTILETAYGRECRLDMDRNGIVDDDNDLEIWVFYFEHLPSPASERADFDGNGIVNFIDISLLIPTIGNDCRPDLNKDGLVNTNDLWFLLAAWGPCP